jgi:hypothetical protein
MEERPTIITEVILGIALIIYLAYQLDFRTYYVFGIMKLVIVEGGKGLMKATFPTHKDTNNNVVKLESIESTRGLLAIIIGSIFAWPMDFVSDLFNLKYS